MAPADVTGGLDDAADVDDIGANARGSQPPLWRSRDCSRW
jgi:hypothetical protein